jgi:phosphoesterase RecJ-like protein
VNNNSQLLKNRLTSASHIALVLHTDPDGDAVGSALVLEGLIKFINPAAKITKTIEPGYKKELNYFTEKYFFTTTLPEADCYIALDAGAHERLSPQLPGQAKVSINIDHHRNNGNFAEINIIDVSAASTGLIIYEIAQDLGCPLSPAMAEGLYVSVSTDTGNFAFANTDTRVFAAALAATKAGAVPNTIYSNVYEQQTLSELQSFGAALKTIRSFGKGKLLVGFIDKNSPLDNRHLIDYIRREEHCQVIAVLVEKPGYIKLSLRSKDNTNVGAIAEHFNGGGHARAASGKISNVTLEQALEQFITYVQEHHII